MVGTLPHNHPSAAERDQRGAETNASGTRAGQVVCVNLGKQRDRPFGLICTMVVPVPCRFALLLKLLTKIFPLVSDPVVVGTRATP